MQDGEGLRLTLLTLLLRVAAVNFSKLQVRYVVGELCTHKTFHEMFIMNRTSLLY